LSVKNKEVEEELTNYIAIKQMRLSAFGIALYVFYLFDQIIRGLKVFGVRGN